ncbi:MAG TPA: YfhO family protein [Thermoanaerobaculia bacterium]|nr:YfhO family protein [Thermoanaerobaculia bacterium]
MDADRTALRDSRAVLLLSAAVFLMFADVLLLGNRFFIRDLTRYYYPTKKIVREVILGGEFPYWNRHYSAGQPMAANPEYEVFYPPQWLVLLPSYDLGFRLHIVLHLWIAALGMYAFLRSLGLRAESSLFGGLVFGLGGLVVSLVNLLPILFVVAWCPLVLLFARRAMLRGSVRDGAAAAIVLGVQCLAGEPTSLVQTCLLIGAYSLYLAWERRGEGVGPMARPLWIALGIGAGGMAAGAAQLLPAIEHVAESARARPFDLSLVTAWSMPWARPLELVIPHLFGHIYEKGTWYWGSGLYPGTGSPFFFSIYGGILAAALIVASLAVRPRGGLPVLMLCAGSGLLALGGHTPLFRLLYDAGLATGVRYPEKWSFIGLFALIVFAAAMFDRMLQGDRKLIDAAIGFTAAVTLLAAGLGALALTDAYAGWFGRVWGLGERPSAAWMAELSKRDWWALAGRGAAALALFWGARRAIGSPSRLWFGAVVLFVIADLAPIGIDVLPRVEARYYTPPPIASQLDPRRGSYRIFPEADWYGSTDVAKRYFGSGEAVYWIVRNGMYPQTPATWGFAMALERDYDKTALLPTVDLVNAMWAVRDRGGAGWREAFMAMSNSWYRTEYRDWEEERKRTGGRLRNARPLDYVKEQEWPRYYFADRVRRVGGEEDLIERLVAGDWTPRTAFVTGEAFEPAGGRVIRAAETANRTSIEVEAEGRAMLVLSVTPHKYWSATLGGERVPIRTVNVGFQGIEVPAGRHRIELRYANRLVQGAMAISAFSLLALVALAARGPKGSAPPAPVPPVAEPDADHVDQHPERVAEDPDPGVG